MKIKRIETYFIEISEEQIQEKMDEESSFEDYSRERAIVDITSEYTARYTSDNLLIRDENNELVYSEASHLYAQS